jgi:hypothetical protein
MFSIFKNHTQNIPIGIISIQELHAQLVNPDRDPFIKDTELIQQLRAATSEIEEKSIKSKLTVFCPGGKVDTRAAGARPEQKNIIYSGFMQIDIDLKDNPNMYDASAVRDKLAEIKYIALSAISARGKGVWGLLALSDPAKFIQYTEQVAEYFRQARITIDKSKSKNPSELRYFAPDPGAILKTGYTLFPLLQSKAKSVQVVKSICTPHLSASLYDLHKWVSETTGYSLIDGQKHYYLFWLSYALRKNGATEAEVYDTIYTIVPQNLIKSNCIRGGIKHANSKGLYVSSASNSITTNTY